MIMKPPLTPLVGQTLFLGQLLLMHGINWRMLRVVRALDSTIQKRGDQERQADEEDNVGEPWWSPRGARDCARHGPH
jgi:hypothetical protein